MVDWHNALIGHMQHNARDPNRDHAHGHLSYHLPFPPLLTPPKLLEHPFLSFLRTLSYLNSAPVTAPGRNSEQRHPNHVAKAAKEWATAQNDDRLKLEALWVSWGADRLNKGLLLELLQSKDHRVRAATVQVLSA